MTTFIESLLKSQLGLIELDNFQYMLDNQISFIGYFDEKSHQIKLLNVAISFFRDDVLLIDTSFILDCFKDSNEKAYHLLLNHPQGKNWLRKTIYDLHQKCKI